MASSTSCLGQGIAELPGASLDRTEEHQREMTRQEEACGSEVEHMSSMRKALHWIPTFEKKKKEEEWKKERKKGKEKGLSV